MKCLFVSFDEVDAHIILDLQCQEQLVFEEHTNTTTTKLLYKTISRQSHLPNEEPVIHGLILEVKARVCSINQIND